MNILTKLRYVPKSLGIVLAIAVAAASTALSFAWGPSRQTYTMAHPADHVVFNSITDNPEYGDEREFLTVRDLTTGETLGGSTTIVAGHEYLFQIYIHNNAASNFNDAKYNYKGIARGTTVETAIPNQVDGSATVAAYVRATNATNPQEVWDTVALKSNGNVKLDYQEGTARLFTNHFKNGTTISDSLITSSGVKVGYDNLNGDWPGCLQYSGTITYRVKALNPATPNFTVQKEVRKAGTSTFTENVTVNPGDKVNYRIIFTNTGQTTLTNVMLKDTLPAGMSFVPGTVRIMNANNPNGAPLANGDSIVTSGVNIGGYTAGSNAIVVFDAIAKSNDQLPACGVNTLQNIATVTPSGQGSKSDTANVSVTKKCEEKTITVCRLSDKVYPVTIKESEFDSSKYSKNPADCKTPEEGTITVCRLSDKAYPVTIKESEFDSSKYSKNPSDCKEPETPKEIASTGPAELIGSLAGTSALGYGAYTYAASRRALRNSRK